MADQAPIGLAWTQISEIGERSSNQDMVGEAASGALSCFVLADGAGGEIASRVVVEAIIDCFKTKPAFGPDALLGYAECASAAVAKRKREEPRYADMSTTVVALLVDRASGQALWAHL